MTMTPMERIVSAVFGTAEKLGIRLMLVGAAARDFWLACFDVRANVRTTHDVDLACLVAEWDGYDRLISTLTAEGGLLPDPRGVRHRLWLADEISVDIVPFGGVGDADRQTRRRQIRRGNRRLRQFPRAVL